MSGTGGENVLDDPGDGAAWVAAWVGREETRRQRIDLQAVAALAATLNRETAPADGEALPPGWQWLFFNPVARQDALAADGHPQRTLDSFLPPVALPHRMWAGSRIRYLAPLPVGAEAQRRSRILRVTPKAGQSGRMCFVTVAHSISSGGCECIAEEQDIVYREAPAAGTPRPAAPPVVPSAPSAPSAPSSPAVQAAWDRTLQPDPVLLFRYSALTFNGHRIHYDPVYAREVEAYRDLVVHGPLTATLLQGLAEAVQPGRRLEGFDFKGLQPLYVNQPLRLCADPGEDGLLLLRALAPDGSTAMAATARFAVSG